MYFQSSVASVAWAQWLRRELTPNLRPVTRRAKRGSATVLQVRSLLPVGLATLVRLRTPHNFKMQKTKKDDSPSP